LDAKEDQYLLQKVTINLEKLTSPAVVSQTEIKIARAQLDLESAEKNLKTVIAGPPIEYYKEQLDEANQAYKDAVDRLKNAKNPGSQMVTAVENALLRVEEAQIDLDNAIAYVVPVEDILRAETEVNLAKNNLALQETLLAYLLGMPLESIENPVVGPELVAIKNAQWDLLAAQRSLELDDLYSPLDGIITNIFVVPGSSVSNTTPIMTVTNDSSMVLRFYLDESDLEYVSINDSSH